MKRSMICVAIMALMVLAPAVYADQVIDPLDDDSNCTWRGITGDATAYSFVPDIPATLTGNSAQIELPNGYSSWWAALQGEYNAAPPFDLSQETHIRFWAKAANATGVTPNVRLILITGSWGTGASHANRDITDVWQQYEIPVTEFQPDPYYQAPSGTNTLTVDWSQVGTFQYAIGYAGGLDATPNTFWIDNIEAVGAAGVSLVSVNPPMGATVAGLPSISVTFNKSVTGVDAADLTVNGSPATVLSGGGGAGPYTFSGYATPAFGTVNVNLAAGGIAAGADNYQGDSWTYELSEFMLAVAPLALNAPTTDGLVGPGEWDDANWYYFDGTDSSMRPGWVDSGAVLTPDDWSCSFAVKHDLNWVYVLTVVTDDVIHVDGPNQWDDDNMEIYFDPNNSDLSTKEGTEDGFQISLTADASVGGGQGYNDWWDAAAQIGPPGYVAEFRISKTRCNMVAGGTYGFDLSPDEDDDSDVRDQQIWWNAQDGGAWDNEIPWGDIFLDPNPLVLPVPGQPQNLTGVGADQYALLTWDPVQYAAEYRVYQSATQGGPYTMVTTSTLTTDVRVDNLVNQQTYYFVVSAANVSGEGPQSAEAAVFISGQSLRARKWKDYR